MTFIKGKDITIVCIREPSLSDFLISQWKAEIFHLCQNLLQGAKAIFVRISQFLQNPDTS